MVIATSIIDISTEECTSLKEKRSVINSIKSRVKSKFNVSIAEIDFLNHWDVSRLGLALVSNEQKYANQLLDQIINFIERYYPGRIMDYDMNFDIRS